MKFLENLLPVSPLVASFLSFEQTQDFHEKLQNSHRLILVTIVSQHLLTTSYVSGTVLRTFYIFTHLLIAATLSEVPSLMSEYFCSTWLLECFSTLCSNSHNDVCLFSPLNFKAGDTSAFLINIAHPHPPPLALILSLITANGRVVKAVALRIDIKAAWLLLLLWPGFWAPGMRLSS